MSVLHEVFESFHLPLSARPFGWGIKGAVGALSHSNTNLSWSLKVVASSRLTKKIKLKRNRKQKAKIEKQNSN